MVGSTPFYHSVLNVKALEGTFNQEKALVGAFSVIVKTDGSFAALAFTLNKAQLREIICRHFYRVIHF